MGLSFKWLGPDMDWTTFIREQLLPTIIALVLVLVYAVMLFQGRIVPDGLEVLVTAVVTFYYGSQSVANARRAAGAEAIEVAKVTTNGVHPNG